MGYERRWFLFIHSLALSTLAVQLDLNAAHSQATVTETSTTTQSPAENELEQLVKQAETLDAEKKYEESSKLWQQVVAIAPNKLDGHFCYAVALHRAGNLVKAETEYKAALKWKAEELNILSNLADAYKEDKKLPEAIDTLKQALAIQPNPAAEQLHIKLAALLEETGATDEAIAQYQVVLEADPRNEIALHNLAGLFQISGQIKQSIATWKCFLKYYPKAEQSAVVRDIIKGLNAVDVAGKSNDNASDYYEEATKKSLLRWKTAVPIKVFIAPSEQMKGSKPQYSKYLADAFDEWTLATPSLKWQRVEFAKDADVVCYYVTAMPKGSIFSTSEGGHSSLVGTESDPHIIGSAKVLIKTLSAEGDSVSDEEIRSVCLHEVGHTLGLNGHSGNPKDAMFYSTSPHPVVELSARDKSTIARLYTSK